MTRRHTQGLSNRCSRRQTGGSQAELGMWGCWSTQSPECWWCRRQRRCLPGHAGERRLKTEGLESRSLCRMGGVGRGRRRVLHWAASPQSPMSSPPGWAPCDDLDAASCGGDSLHRLPPPLPHHSYNFSLPRRNMQSNAMQCNAMFILGKILFKIIIFLIVLTSLKPLCWPPPHPGAAMSWTIIIIKRLQIIINDLNCTWWSGRMHGR